jgi:hypothetical protein
MRRGAFGPLWVISNEACNYSLVYRFCPSMQEGISIARGRKSSDLPRDQKVHRANGVNLQKSLTVYYQKVH